MNIVQSVLRYGTLRPKFLKPSQSAGVEGQGLGVGGELGEDVATIPVIRRGIIPDLAVLPVEEDGRGSAPAVVLEPIDGFARAEGRLSMEIDVDQGFRAELVL